MNVEILFQVQLFSPCGLLCRILGLILPQGYLIRMFVNLSFHGHNTTSKGHKTSLVNCKLQGNNLIHRYFLQIEESKVDPRGLLKGCIEKKQKNANFAETSRTYYCVWQISCSWSVHVSMV